MIVIVAVVIGLVVRQRSRQEAEGAGEAAQVQELAYSLYYNDDGTLNWLKDGASDVVELCPYLGLELKYSDMNLAEDADEETILTKLSRYLTDYLTDSCQISSMDDGFVEQQTRILYYEFERDYEFERAVQELSYGTSYENIYDYYGVEESEYDAYVEDQGFREAVLSLIVQAIAEQEDLSVTQEDVDDYLQKQEMQESFAELCETYGSGYLYHITLQDKVLSYLEQSVTLTKDGAD